MTLGNCQLQHRYLKSRNDRAMNITKKQQIGKRITLRMSDDLYAEILAAATGQCISMSAEIIARLRAGPPLVLLSEIKQQGAETKKMVQQLLDAD